MRWRLLALSAGLAMLSAADDRVCGECHKEIVDRFRGTAMARALAPVSECDTLRDHPVLEFEDHGYRSRIVREGKRSILTVTGEGETLQAELLWAFGRGQAGQTYVFQHDGAFYESRLSYYNALRKLDLTMGAHPGKPSGTLDAAGHKLAMPDARDCFGCHSNGGVAGGTLHFETLSPGLTCSSCHTGTERHAASGAEMTHMAAMGAEEMSELCGKCHRTWSQIASGGPRGALNVRFQPYRLTNSKCFSVSDARIRCTACHDAHGAVETRASAYDAKCASCHAGGKVCPVGKRECVTCHMPKIDLPGAHANFTDHQIRVVRAGEAYPN